jgi:hypothetical protein
MAKNISKGDLRKQDFLVLKQSRDDTVTSVIAPNGLQIGLTDERFQNPLTAKGPIIGEAGLTGSLTQLVDGSPYLAAGANILLTTGSTGQITIATSLDSVAVHRNKQQYTITSADVPSGTDILVTGAGFSTIGIQDTNDFIDVYLNSKLMLSGTAASVAAGTADYYIKSADSELVFGFDVLVNDTIVTTVISSGSANTPSAGDGLSLSSNTYNVLAASTGGVQISSDELSIKLKTASALATTSDGLSVDINSLTQLSSGVDAANDKLLIYDANTGALKAVAPNLIGATAALDIASVSSSLTESTLASGDLFAVADVNDSNAVKKITVEDYGEYLASQVNGGLGEYTAGKLVVDISNLSTRTIDPSADFITFNDVDAGISGFSNGFTRKASIADFVSAIAGTVTATGLAPSAGTLKLDITNQTSVGTIHTSDEIIIWDADTSSLKKATVNQLQAGD